MGFRQTLLWILPAESREDFTELFDAYQRDHVSVILHYYSTSIPDVEEICTRYPKVDAVLICGNPKRAPSTVLKGPFITREDGKKIPASWFPMRNSLCSRRFSKTAAQVHLRTNKKSCLALLSQWHPKYLKLVDRLEVILENDLHLIRWTGDIISREDVVHALGSGLGLAIYLGHGRPKGWVGYYGMRSHHFYDFKGNPSGGILSLCCRTASRKGTGFSFAESLVLSGVSACSFGAIKETRHTDNTRWAVRMSELLKSDIETVGQLIVAAAPLQPSAYESYRLIGDPLAPIKSNAVSLKRANMVKTYA
jgi:hypothetical protein